MLLAPRHRCQQTVGVRPRTTWTGPPAPCTTRVVVSPLVCAGTAVSCGFDLREHLCYRRGCRGAGNGAARSSQSEARMVLKEGGVRGN